LTSIAWAMRGRCLAEETGRGRGPVSGHHFDFPRLV
jgi:hypothetical protein